MIQENKETKVRIKVWLDANGHTVLGEGGAALLRAIQKTGSISRAAKEIGVSYKFAWDYIKNIEKILGKKIVNTFKGGNTRGGTVLTEEGIKVLEEYEKARGRINACISEFENFEIFGETKNRLKVKVKQIVKGTDASIIIGEVPKGTTLRVLITKEALQKLGLKRNTKCGVMIKASSFEV